MRTVFVLLAAAAAVAVRGQGTQPAPTIPPYPDCPAECGGPSDCLERRLRTINQNAYTKCIAKDYNYALAWDNDESSQEPCSPAAGACIYVDGMNDDGQGEGCTNAYDGTTDSGTGYPTSRTVIVEDGQSVVVNSLRIAGHGGVVVEGTGVLTIGSDTASHNLAQNCTSAIVGCPLPGASNFDPNADVNSGGCTVDVGTASGCTYEFAVNYDPSATLDDGSCIFQNFGGGAGFLATTEQLNSCNVVLANASASLDACQSRLEHLETCGDQYAESYVACATKFSR